jgi:hypothetical protein
LRDSLETSVLFRNIVGALAAPLSTRAVRPLATEDQTVPAGFILLKPAWTFCMVTFPVSGLTGTLARFSNSV